jgi:nitronate monooxygenase
MSTIDTTTEPTTQRASMSTRFTELVGCRVPVQQAPMGGVGGPALIAASVDAGALGMIGLTGYPVEAVIATMDHLVDHVTGSLGGNFVLPFLEDRAAVTACAERADVVDLYHGAPDAGLVALVHAAGALASWQVCSAEEAEQAVDAGADFIAVRGVEGGGRMPGHRALWPLLCDVLDAVGDQVPVLAAGGIGTGRGLAAVLAAGADGVRIGTVLVATEESDAHPGYKAALLGADAGDSVLTHEFSTGWPGGPAQSRVLRQCIEAARTSEHDVVGFVDRGGQREDVLRFAPSPPSSAFEGDIAAMPHYAGESVTYVRTVEPAADVIGRIVTDAEHLLRASTAITTLARRPAPPSTSDLSSRVI